MRAAARSALIAIALIAGCATLRVMPRDARPFDLVGRVLVTSTTGALTANMRWEHDGERDQIWLMTPTGQTLAYIVDSSEGAVLTRADQQQYRSSSVEALTRQALGWSLPLGLLRYWVQGNPAPTRGPPQIERGANGAATLLVQEGWRVAITYFDEPNAAKVRRLDLSDGAHEIRLVIDTWRSLDDFLPSTR